MRIRSILRWLAVPLLFLSFQLCRAQSFDIGGTNGGFQLWDLSGTYSLDLEIQQSDGNTEEMTFSFIMTQDAAGRLHGPVNADFEQLTFIDPASTNYFTVTYRIVGNVTSLEGANNGARARFTIFLSGNGELGGQNVNVMAGKITVDAVPGNGILAGTFPNNTKVSFDFGRFGGLHGIADLNNPALPADVTGEWLLNLQFKDLSPRLVGTGTITTSTGQILGFNVGGTFSEANGYSIKFRGAGDVPGITMSGVGSTAAIFLSPDLSTIQLFNGRVMGQKFLFAFP